MSKVHFDFTCENYVITGASSGIGRGICIDCSKMGATVHLMARNEERLNETLSQMEREGHVIHKADLCSSEDIYNMIDELPKIDGVILCAGIIKTMLVPELQKKNMVHIFACF